MFSIKRFKKFRCSCSLGEGLFLSKDEGYWVDINKNTLFSSKRNKSYKLESKPSVIFEKNNDEVILGTESGVSIFNETTLEEKKIKIDFNHDIREYRSNDGVKFLNSYILGFMHRDTPDKKKGYTYVVKNGLASLIDDQIFIPNSFIPINEKTILISDSFKGLVWSVSFDEKKIKKELWKDFGKNFSPDGGCKINEKIFFCFWGDASIQVFNLKGDLLQKIKMPFKNPTNCKFDDKNNLLWVTSARESLNNLDLRVFPESGDTIVFKLKY